MAAQGELTHLGSLVLEMSPVGGATSRPGRYAAIRRTRRTQSDGGLPQEERPRPADLEHPRKLADRDRQLDREDLPPASHMSRSRTIDPGRARVDHGSNRHPGGVTPTVSSSCSSPHPCGEILSFHRVNLPRPSSPSRPDDGRIRRSTSTMCTCAFWP